MKLNTIFKSFFYCLNLYKTPYQYACNVNFKSLIDYDRLVNEEYKPRRGMLAYMNRNIPTRPTQIQKLSLMEAAKKGNITIAEFLSKNPNIHF